jgi:thymidylate synthase
MNPYNETYRQLLSDIWHNGYLVKTRGTTSKEVLCRQFTIDPKDNVITIPGFETNKAYAEKELEWYFAGTNRIDFDPLIQKTWAKFSDDGKTVNSAYGYRIFGSHPDFPNQWEWVKAKLKEDPDSRQCLINLNYPADKLKPTKDFICTVALQVFIRKERLHWLTFLRSQDVYYGTRNDVFCFTGLQKQLADEVGVRVGRYTHFCGSIHLYDKQWPKVKELLGVRE